MLLPIKSLDQFQWGSVPVTAKTLWEVCWRKAQEQAQHCCSLRVCPVICSSWKDVRHRIKIAVRVAVPRKPCSLLLASYTTLSRGDFPWSFACCCHLCNFSLCQLGLYGFPKHFRLFFTIREGAEDVAGLKGSFRNVAESLLNWSCFWWYWSVWSACAQGFWVLFASWRAGQAGK